MHRDTPGYGAERSINMKKLWDNKSILYKLIAIMLTVVMVVTPLYIHFERRYDAKADELPKIIIMEENESTLQDFSGIARTGKKYYYKLNGVQSIIYTTDIDSNPTESNTLNNEANFEVTFGTDTSKYRIISYTKNGGETVTPAAPIPFPKIVWDTDASLNLSVSAEIKGDDFVNGDFNVKADDVLKVTIKTGFALTSLSIFGNDIPTSQISYSGGTADEDYVRTYTYEYKFSGDTNTSFDNKDIVVKDEKNTGEGKKISCNNLVYDTTKPTISENSTGNLDTTKIYKSYTYNYIIKSGSGSVESAIYTAYYKINDGTEQPIVSGGVAHGAVNINDGTGEVIGSIDIPSNLPDGTKITLYAKDKAGNDKTEEFTVVIDSTDPVIESVKVKKDNTEYNLSFFASEWFNADDIMSIKVSDNLKLQNISVLGSGDSELSSKEDLSVAEYTYEGSINELLGMQSGQTLEDRTYTIKVKVDDYAVSSTNSNDNTNNSVTTTYTLNVDSTEPSYETPELRTSGPAYANATVDNNVYYINKETELTESTDGLYYAVKISDTASGVKNDTVKLYNSNNEEVAAISNGTVAPGTQISGYYTFKIPFQSQTVGTPQAYTIKGEDNAGNEFTIDDLPKICVIDTDIKFKNLKLTGADERIISGDDIDNLKYSNQVYTLSFNVTSGYEITEVGIEEGDTDNPTNIITKTTTGGYDSITKLYTQEISFDIPASTLDNVTFDKLRIYAKDNKSSGRKETKLLQLLMYDSTDPVVRGADGTTAITVDNEWHKSYTLSAMILSGLNTTESELAEAKYSITGSDSAADISMAISDTKTAVNNITIPESNNITGTTITFNATDKAGNKLSENVSEKKAYTIKVDATDPKINALTAGGNEANTIPLTGDPSIATSFSDNLTIGVATITVTLPDNSVKTYVYSDVVDQRKDISVSKAVSLSTLIGKSVTDGDYKVKLDIADMAGNTASKQISFTVDNTAPELDAKVVRGTSAKSNGYYNTDVVVRLSVKDNNFDASSMKVTDKGEALSPSWRSEGGAYIADVTFSSEGIHDIAISGKDKSGTAGAGKQVAFVIDKTDPTLSITVGGGTVYNENMGALKLTSTANISVSITDNNADSEDLRVQVIKTVPDSETTTTEFLPTSNRTFSFSDEADYEINFYAVDLANNQGPTRTIRFRVDTTAPTLTISGVNGGTSASAVTVGFNITESFWKDASGTVTIYRKPGDGQEEALYKTLTVTPTQRAYTLSELISDTGVYRFEFEAKDSVGHTAKTDQSITVDRNKPEIRLIGVKNYDSTDRSVSISATVSDEFYLGKTVTATGTILRADGTKGVVNFGNYSQVGNPTTIEQTFSEDGIYDITISSKDIAGNESVSMVHFTIDTTAPVIGDLSKYDGKTVNEIDLDIDVDELVSDLTVCKIRMYLNGVEYDGYSDIEDGSYTLLITAEDELGHTSEKSATFVLDTKEPVFIVTGVEEGEIKEEAYNIEVSLQLDDDILDEVRLNDTKALVDNKKTSKVNVTDEGNYELYMKAHDEAGNVAEKTISFTLGDEKTAAAATTESVADGTKKSGSHAWIWVVLGALVLGGGGFFLVLLKRRRNE